MEQNISKKDKYSTKYKNGYTALFIAAVFFAGIVLLIYGFNFNSVSVITQEAKTQDQNKPNIDSVKKSAKSESSLQLTEAQVIRDVTVGGLMRQTSGKIQRTYIGRPPSLCPT